jgi:ribonuclease HI
LERKELGKADSNNWVAYFEGAQSCKGLGAGVFLVSPTGEHLKYVVQLAFPREGCASSTVEFEGLLAGLRIAAGLGINRLAVWGDSQLTDGQADKASMSPVMETYTAKVQKLERCFSTLELEHGPYGQNTIVKKLPQITAKGLSVPVEAFVEWLSKSSTTPKEVARAPSTSTLGALPATAPPADAAKPSSERCSLPVPPCRSS